MHMQFIRGCIRLVKAEGSRVGHLRGMGHEPLHRHLLMVRTTEALPKGDRGDAGKGSGSKETKKDKKNKREKAHRQDAKGSSRGEENRLLDGKRRSSSSPGASTTPEAVATAPTLAAAGTASAGGGRWVHVPN